MTTNPQLSQLRHLLHQEPSVGLWERLCAVLDTCAKRDRTIALDYAQQHLTSWPIKLRYASPDVCARLSHDTAPVWWGLVRSACLRGVKRDVLEHLLLSGRLAKIQTLKLKSNRLGTEGAKILADTTQLPQLRVLSLAWNDLRIKGAAQLVRARFRLRSLNLQMNALENAGVNVLADAQMLRELQALDLSHNAVGVAGVARLADTPNLQNLRYLSLANSERHDAEINLAMLHATSRIKRLQRLDFANNPVGPGVAQALSGLRGLTHLNLHGCNIQDRGVHDLVGSPNFAVVRWLSLAAGSSAHNRDLMPVTNASAKSLAESPHTHHLETLSLAGAQLGTDGVHVLANASPLRLCNLVLRHVRLGNEGIRALASGTALTHLHTLDLTSTDIGPSGLDALGASTSMPNLRSLSLSANIRLSVDDFCRFLKTPLGHQLHSLECPNTWILSIAQERLGAEFPPDLQSTYVHPQADWVVDC